MTNDETPENRSEALDSTSQEQMDETLEPDVRQYINHQVQAVIQANFESQFHFHPDDSQAPERIAALIEVSPKLHDAWVAELPKNGDHVRDMDRRRENHDFWVQMGEQVSGNLIVLGIIVVLSIMCFKGVWGLAIAGAVLVGLFGGYNIINIVWKKGIEEFGAQLGREKAKEYFAAMRRREHRSRTEQATTTAIDTSGGTIDGPKDEDKAES